ncbi:MAG: hypothetical protein IJL05_00840 [Alphaproteobacteria bacterium]|nr:hypothetical protein [Alphaproteobacteria bacterium]
MQTKDVYSADDETALKNWQKNSIRAEKEQQGATQDKLLQAQTYLAQNNIDTTGMSNEKILSEAQKIWNQNNPELMDSDIDFEEIPDEFFNQDINPELANIIQIIEQVLVMEPVSTLTGQEFQKDGTKLTEKVNNYYKENYNNQVERDGVGTILLDERAIQTSIAHGVGKEKAAAFQAVPEVIKNGLIFDEQTKWKDRNYDSVSFIAPITINGERYVCEVIVKKTKDKNRFYLHEVEIEKNLADVFKSSLDTATSAKSKLSIAKKWQEVKTTSKEKTSVYNQKTIGAWNPLRKTIELGTGANETTLPHELSHFWLDNMMMYSRMAQAAQNEGFARVWNNIKRYLNIDDRQDVVNVAQAEKYTSAYMQYIRNNKTAPKGGIVNSGLCV